MQLQSDPGMIRHKHNGNEIAAYQTPLGFICTEEIYMCYRNNQFHFVWVPMKAVWVTYYEPINIQRRGKKTIAQFGRKLRFSKTTMSFAITSILRITWLALAVPFPTHIRNPINSIPPLTENCHKLERSQSSQLPSSNSFLLFVCIQCFTQSMQPINFILLFGVPSSHRWMLLLWHGEFPDLSGNRLVCRTYKSKSSIHLFIPSWLRPSADFPLSCLILPRALQNCYV